MKILDGDLLKDYFLTRPFDYYSTSCITQVIDDFADVSYHGPVHVSFSSKKLWKKALKQVKHELKHGEWIRVSPNSNSTWAEYECHNCGERYACREEHLPKYCPSCGRKMKLESAEVIK